MLLAVPLNSQIELDDNQMEIEGYGKPKTDIK